MAGELGLVLAAATAALPPAPPIAVSTAAPAVVSGEQRLLSWHPGEVRCEGMNAPRVITLRRPLNSLAWGDRPLASATFSFAIDASGRPLSIRREGGEPGWHDELAPALASSRFAPGGARQRCTVSYAPRREALNEAPRVELASFMLHSRQSAMPRLGLDRLREGDGCASTPGMQAIVRVYPDLKDVPPTPGVPDWTLVGFDVRPDGRPSAVRTVAGTGNAALDAAAITALTASRFNAGPLRKQCVLPFRHRPATLAAPPAPNIAEPANGPCARDGGWAIAPKLDYPHPYRMRAIEGWAVLDYDVASWGAIGNVRIIEAQPSEDFGISAKAKLERARRPAGPGATGCRTRVRYAMAKDGVVPGEPGVGGLENSSEQPFR